MQFISVSQLIPILQTAIGPAILISGIGLLLLTMTNRLGHVVDRARTLSATLLNVNDGGRTKIVEQIQILWRRTHLIRLAIILASVSALLSSILIIVLFVSTLWRIEIAWLIVLLFIISMGCLMGSLIVFIYDVNQSLVALRLELVDNGIKNA